MEKGDVEFLGDAHGRPRLNIIRDVCIYILVMELAERLCFYTFTGSINVYLRDYLGYTQAVSSAMVASFNTLVYVTPLIGGYVADAHWGRFRAIAAFGALYFAGMALMAASSVPGSERRQSGLFMVSPGSLWPWKHISCSVYTCTRGARAVS